MNLRKMLAVVLIWCVVSAGWMVLGTTVLVRTENVLDPEGRHSRDVAALWGAPQVQQEPVAAPLAAKTVADAAANGQGKKSVETVADPALVQPIARSVVTVRIDTENRRRGLRWFPVYTVEFRGEYTVKNSSDRPQEFTVTFTRPKTDAEVSGQEVTVGGQALPAWTDVVNTGPLAPGQSTVVTFAYRSAGTDSWTYDLPDDQLVRDLALTVSINSPDYDFAVDGSPAEKRVMEPGPDGRYVLAWNKQLITNARDVKLLMPTRAQPGSLVSRITYFAPVCLFFFFVVMIAIQVVRKLQLHPMHYLFLAAAFFAFDLLLAYLVDHVDLHGAFWISAAVSVFLVIMYLWLVAGPRTAVLYAGLSQLVYLVLFSYSFFLENFTGLTVTIGSVLTLAVLMLLTARVRWGEEMPELERRRRDGWVSVADLARAATDSAAGDSGDNAMPGFLGEKNGQKP